MVYIVMFNVACFTFSAFVPNMLLRGFVAFIIGILFPILVVAICRIRSHSQFGRFLYMFAFKHFFGLLLLSLLIALISMLFVNCSDKFLQICFDYKDFSILKLLIISFVIVNGLLLPFIIPLKGFYRILNLTKEEVNTIQENLDDKLSETAEQLEEFCSKI